MNHKYLHTENFNYYLVILPIMALLLSFVLWAYFFEIDEVVKAQGKVVPTGQSKEIQHLEGGIIVEILASEGEQVMPGEAIYRIRNQYFLSQKIEKEIELLASRAKIFRIKALLDDKEALYFDDDILEKIPTVAQRELEVFFEVKNNLELQMKIMQEQLEQKKSQLRELKLRIENLKIEFNLAIENINIQNNLKNSGAISHERYLQHLAKKQELYTQLEEAQATVPVVESEISEQLAKIKSEKTKMRFELLKELSGIEIEVSKLEETLKADIDRESRTEIVSPVKGVVNKLYFHTLGGVIKPGDTVAEISPLEDELIIEAKIRASDRASIYPGQPVSIEVTAYNFSKYGLINGTLTGIAPDSFLDEKTGESYYEVRIEAEQYQFDENSPILIGMAVRANILASKRTIMEYILKPIRDIGYKALNEY